MGQITKSAAVKLKDVQSVGEKTITAVVTAPTLDRDDEIIDTASLRLPLKGGGFKYARDVTADDKLDIPFMIDHSRSVEDCIGSGRSAVINEAGELQVVFGVSTREKAQDMFTLLDEGHLDNAFSITVLYDYANMSYDEASETYAVYDAEVIEISLVFRGSNRNARLLAVSKSLQKKGQKMSDDVKRSPELEAKYKKLAELTKEIEADEEQAKPEEPSKEDPKPVEEPKPETPKVEDTEPEKEEVPQTPTPTPPVEVKPTPAEANVVEAPTEVEEHKEATIKSKEVTNMTPEAQKEIASKAAATKTPVVDNKPEISVKADPNAHKVLIAKQISAFNNKDWARLGELNKQGEKLDEQDGMVSKSLQEKKKALTYAQTSPLYLAEQLNRDVETCYGQYGNLGQLVNKITLTTSPKFRTIVADDTVDFVPVGWTGTKPEDQATFSSVAVEPKPFAVIQVWNDHAADDAAINLYNVLVDQVAAARARLEDNLILNFTTVTSSDGVVYPTQGLIPKLNATTTYRTQYAYTTTGANSFVQAYGTALGKVKSCDRGNVSMVINSADWISLALLQDLNGNLIFQAGTGASEGMFRLGNLGMVRIVTSDAMPAGRILVGNFKRYYLGEKGGLELTTSNEATVGSLNLFTTDNSALRAVVRYEGNVSAASLAGSFSLLQTTAVV